MERRCGTKCCNRRLTLVDLWRSHKVWYKLTGPAQNNQPHPSLFLLTSSGRGWRVCADSRLLNTQTVSDNYPLPLLRSFQNKIKGSKVFSVTNLHSAFHHLPLHPQDVNKTCVLSPAWGGAFVFKRLAFGLSNGPARQKYVDGILQE